VNRPLFCPDLGATVFKDSVPAGLADELPGLYSSIFSTLDWFLTYDQMEPEGAVVLEEPRHVLLFAVRGDTVEVLNKVIVISPRDVWRAGAALWRALPHARRIHIEVKFPPQELRVPKRVLYDADAYVVDLPATVDEYNASLGKSTRRNLRTYENRLRHGFPSVAGEIVPAGERAGELVDLLVEWKIARFRALGRQTSFEREPQNIVHMRDLVRRRGTVYVTSIDGEAVALVVMFYVGDAACLFHYTYHPTCDYYHLGLLTQYWATCDAISRGAKRLDLLWGTTEYKMRLGARPQRATRLSVFRHEADRLWSLREAAWVLRHRAKRSQEYYWRQDISYATSSRAGRPRERRRGGVPGRTTGSGGDRTPPRPARAPGHFVAGANVHVPWLSAETALP
jgi:hypothetical protein